MASGAASVYSFNFITGLLHLGQSVGGLFCANRRLPHIPLIAAFFAYFSDVHHQTEVTFPPLYSSRYSI